MKVYEKMNTNTRERVDQNNPLLQPSACLQTPEKGLNFVRRVKGAYYRSSSFVDFFGKFALIVFETTGWILIASLLAIPVSMIVVGTLYLQQCKRQPYIPIYLVVGGCFGVVKNVLNLIQSWVNGCGHRTKEDVKTNPLAVVLSWFLLAWFITGSVWIYRIYNDFDIQDETSNRYCHPTLYLYSFWITTVTYAFTALACFGFCVITSLVLSFDSDASKASLMNCFGNILWILYWYFTRYEAVGWPGFKYRGNAARQRLSCAESDLQQTV
ncbi:hypothetical protein HELRODRAFT_186116 [Helobdella robusta]|uniref:MARVEL domain-containing protein n=1 Tax=Helobdella robusta TaxID=6412 RepID=T1FNP1_HELRO|nr:hypothetical protein HELRODRAFT_186116 [Helobdella robusta]ESN93316.1 hypothetical protein HELRODRAFT_186116 [Helobdella robusta]